MRENDKIQSIESDIDRDFEENELKNLDRTTALWTLLSVAEDYHFEIREIQKLPDTLLIAYIDGLINWLSHPLRVCFKQSERGGENFKRELIDDHYGWAVQWIDKAIIYTQFYTIFSLWHRGKLKLWTEGNKLVTDNQFFHSLEYEAYNRLIKKTGDGKQMAIDPNNLVDEIVRHTTIDRNTFKVNFNPKFVEFLKAKTIETFSNSYHLPEDWKFTGFTLGHFKSVFVTIKALMLAWYIARVVVARKGMVGAGYPSSVWIVDRAELINMIAQYLDLSADIVKKIFETLTYGERGIKNPDIATQPLVNIGNGNVALGPLLWLNADAERNFCVLLNKIDEEKEIYSRLVESKESLLKNEFNLLVDKLDLDIKWGCIRDGLPDVDLAIIDRNNKCCIVLELKWFIEPSEVREVQEKSIELEKGVRQAIHIHTAFNRGTPELMNLLKIDSSYKFLSVVASKNWIGHFDVQNDNIPIIKTGHLLKKLEESKNLPEVYDWLLNRAYLPKKGLDFDVLDLDLQLGRWHSKWYGIKPLTT